MFAWFLLNGAILAVVVVGSLLLMATPTVVGRWVGYFWGQFFSNNNFRALALILIALVFIVEAFFAGFGEGIFYLSSRELFEFADKALGYETPPTPVSDHTSWWWWKIAGVTLAMALIYLPIALRDELFDAIGNSWNRASRRGTVSGSATAGQAGSGGASASGKWTIWKDFGTDLASEGAWEILRSVIYNTMGRRVI